MSKKSETMVSSGIRKRITAAAIMFLYISGITPGNVFAQTAEQFSNEGSIRKRRKE